MAGSENQQPNRPNPPKREADGPRKPLQVMHISRKEGKESRDTIPSEEKPNKEVSKESYQAEKVTIQRPDAANIKEPRKKDPDIEDPQAKTMADLFGSQTNSLDQTRNINDDFSERVVDDFDFDEDAFLAALDENEPIGTTGEIAKGQVIAVESDGIYVDIGGKAPGFMPKNECGLGVITNLKERFPKGLQLEVLVTREQNADGMVTISCRALELRKSWQKVSEMEKEAKVVKVKINGFNRGGVTCDLEGLRGFIPRSQLEDGQNHESLVGKIIGTAFLEVNPETRKLVLSEKKAAITARFTELEIGQLVEGQVAAIKPYGFFIDLGGVSGLLHQSVITNGSIRSLREIFRQGDTIKALITELDARRGRISLNTALLEEKPGEIIDEKNKVMEEAVERAKKAISRLEEEKEKKSTKDSG